MNYREQLQHFITQAQDIHRDEKEITSRSINVIRELERRRAPSNCGMKEKRTRYVPAAVRHQVWMRDQGQCAHRYPDGSRCGERMMLELDHRNMFCRGGDHSVENLELKCRQHNHFAAEQALGAGWFQARVRRET